jgi:hypothetical protein
MARRVTAKWLILLVVAAALSSIPVACGASSKQSAPAHQETFKDSTGEAPASGDIKTVTVSNDALGVLTFQVAFAKLKVKPRLRDRETLGPVSAVSTSSISVLENVTCAVPATAAAQVRNVKVGDHVGIRCELINGRWTLVSGNESTVVVYLDTDRHRATGARAHFGAEYALIVSSFRREEEKQGGGLHFEYSLRRWGGTRFTEFFSGKTSSGVGQLAFDLVLDSYLLGRGPKGFVLTVATKYGSQPSIQQVGSTWPVPIEVGRLRTVDQAPDPGQPPWRFDTKVKPVQVSVTGFTTKPKTPKAGQTISATTSVEASAAGYFAGALDGSCDVTVDGKLPFELGQGMNLIGEEDSTKAKAECEWPVPHDGVGKLFKGVVKLSFRGKSLTRSFSARINR